MNLKALYKDYKKETQGDIVPANSPIKMGGVYFGTFKKKPFWFLVVDAEGELCECLKMSDWICFHSSHNLLVDIGPIKLLIEPANNFWLTKDEISTFKLVYELNTDIVQEILDYRDGEPLKTLRKGLTPIFEDDVREQFDRDEFEMIKDYHLRVFALLCEEEPLEDGQFEDEDDWVEPRACALHNEPFLPGACDRIKGVAERRFFFKTSLPGTAIKK
jgi:hypothetical protein